jgi:5-oxoprolinase (ATP-hydrolysing)
MAARYQLWVDRGGTFTDCILRDRQSGEVKVHKLLSSDDAPVVAARRLLGLAPDEALPPCEVRLGTTLATNALLERNGEPFVLVMNRGLGDVPEIGTQARPDLFTLHVEKPEVIYAASLEVSGRSSADGAVLEPLDELEARARLGALRSAGFGSIAIALIHAHVDGRMESRLAELASEAGFAHVSASHRVAPEEGLLARADTTAADAYLSPIILDYVRSLTHAWPSATLRLMQSSGGLRSPDAFSGKDAVLSGPAGGVVAVSTIARSLGVSAAIGFDMGGTSTDICRVAGEPSHIYENEVAGVRLRSPMLAVHTVAAGGGSLCRLDGLRLTVGPESAGAVPGPACYGHPDATTLALTDIALVLGRIHEAHFPFPLQRERSEAALAAVVADLARKGIARDPDAVARGFFEIAVETMAAAIREVTVKHGHDVREHQLIVFGGAGGQYAGAVARRLGVRRLILHPYAGVQSAYGIGVAPVSDHRVRDGGHRDLEGADLTEIRTIYIGLAAEGRAALVDEGFTAESIEILERIDLRHPRTLSVLTLPLEPMSTLRTRFDALHEVRFGYVRPDAPVEIAAFRVEARAASTVPPSAPSERRRPSAARTARLFVEGEGFRDVPVLERDELDETPLEGPCLVLDETSTLVVDPGFVLSRGPDGVLFLEDVQGLEVTRADTALDPVRLEVFSHLFSSIAEQMGHVLRRTAMSTNIRDRLDFSCAVFDRRGELVANAPHIPVHLGAMSETVRALMASGSPMEPGDVLVSNDPGEGGSHLPDITVVTPVFDERRELRFFVASRGHHADVGGVEPGSMPPFSSSLDEEGVVFRRFRLVHAGEFDEMGLRAHLASGAHPARNPDENVADLAAQVAANRLGVSRLHELVTRYGSDVVEAYMDHVQDDAAVAVREAIAALPDGVHSFEDALDDGHRIAVRIEIAGERMTVDFTGTSPSVPSNLNAPRAVTMAAVIYVLRCLSGRPIPLNSGCLHPVSVILPEDSLLNPRAGRAVAAGNVETSQRIVDVLLGALGLCGASQGTMNNLTFGGDDFGYYETLAGGAGATREGDGASAVHTHMTNSRITDPEILEQRFPVRLRQFAVRRGSGGDGLHRGGDGVIREIEFLAPLSVSLIAERRARPPYGAQGGAPGRTGEDTLDGVPIAGRTSFRVRPGQVLKIATPGGGGYGAPHGSTQ